MTLSIYDKFITQTDSGETIPNAIVTVTKISGGVGPADLWQDKAGTIREDNPVTASPLGRVTFYLTPGTYTISAEFGGDTITYNDVVVSAENTQASRDLFIDGVDFTGGVTTELTLQMPPNDINNTIVTFDDAFVGPDKYSLSGSVITFNTAIPDDVTRVYVWYGVYLSSSYFYNELIELIDDSAQGNITPFSELTTYTELNEWVEQPPSGGAIYRPKPSALPIAAGPFDSDDWVLAQLKTSAKDYTELRALKGINDGFVVNVAERTTGNGGGGPFYWNSSDLSTEVATDEVTTGEGDGGKYVAPASDKTGASGAWVRARQVTIADYGAVGGQDSTDAITAAKNSNYNIHIPKTPKASPFIIDGNIQLRDGQKITGDGGRPELSGEDASYIQFTAGSSFLAGDKASAASRIKVYCKDVYFIGADGSGSQGEAGDGIAFDGSMGGRIESCTFDALEAAVENPWSFFITYSDIDVTGCDKGLDIDDSNACVIEKFFARGTRRPINGGSDSARLVLRDVSINMNDNVEIGIDVNGGVIFDGYTYLESFDSGSPATDQTGIRYSSTQFSARPAYIGNILIDNGQGGMAYGLCLDSINNFSTNIKGLIENVKFSGTFSSAPIGYGIHDSSFDTLFVPIDIDSCPGLVRTDVVGEQPSLIARIPATSTKMTATTSVAGATFIVIPLDDEIIYDNVDAFSTVTDKYRVRKTGYYVLDCVLQGDASLQARFEIDGNGEIAITSETPCLHWEGILTAAQTVEVVGRSGTNVVGGTFSARYISQGE